MTIGDAKKRKLKSPSVGFMFEINLLDVDCERKSGLLQSPMATDLSSERRLCLRMRYPRFMRHW